MSGLLACLHNRTYPLHMQSDFFLSIPLGLDEITYGGRRSRRGSVSETTYSYSSRRGSVTASNAGDYAALMAATAALEATSNNPASKQNDKQQQQTVESESGIGNSPKSINLSRQNSTRLDDYLLIF